MCAKSRQFASGQPEVDSESGGCTTDDYETTNGDEEFDEHSLTDDERRQLVVCAKCTLKNKVENTMKCIILVEDHISDMSWLRIGKYIF